MAHGEIYIGGSTNNKTYNDFSKTDTSRIFKVENGGTLNLGGTGTLAVTSGNSGSCEPIYVNQKAYLNLLAGSDLTFNTNNDSGIETASGSVTTFNGKALITKKGGNGLDLGRAGLWILGGTDEFNNGSDTTVKLESGASGASALCLEPGRQGYTYSAANLNEGSKLTIVSDASKSYGINLITASNTGTSTLVSSGAVDITMNGSESVGVNVTGSKSVAKFTAGSTKITVANGTGINVVDGGDFAMKNATVSVNYGHGVILDGIKTKGTFTNTDITAYDRCYWLTNGSTLTLDGTGTLNGTSGRNTQGEPICNDNSNLILAATSNITIAVSGC